MNWIKNILNKLAPLSEDTEMTYGVKDFGRIRETYNNWLFIDKRTWVPGLWAGSAGATIMINDKKYTITDVDHNRKALKVIPKPYLVKEHDTIYPNFYKERIT